MRFWGQQSWILLPKIFKNPPEPHLGGSLDASVWFSHVQGVEFRAGRLATPEASPLEAGLVRPEAAPYLLQT